MSENVVSLQADERGIGPAPKHFAPDQQQAWDAIVAACEPGVLIRADRLILELAATTLARHRIKTNRATRRILFRLLKDCLIPEESNSTHAR
jgi:hypothetical protein